MTRKKRLLLLLRDGLILLALVLALWLTGVGRKAGGGANSDKQPAKDETVVDLDLMAPGFDVRRESVSDLLGKPVVPQPDGPGTPVPDYRTAKGELRVWIIWMHQAESDFARERQQKEGGDLAKYGPPK